MSLVGVAAASTAATAGVSGRSGGFLKPFKALATIMTTHNIYSQQQVTGVCSLASKRTLTVL